jgi:hypothetical protein
VTGPDGSRRLDSPDDYVRLEIEAAINAKIPILPVLVGAAQMPTTKELPPSLHEITDHGGVSLRDDSWKRDVLRLTRAIERQTHSLPIAGTLRWRRAIPTHRWSAENQFEDSGTSRDLMPLQASGDVIARAGSPANMPYYEFDGRSYLSFQKPILPFGNTDRTVTLWIMFNELFPANAANRRTFVVFAYGHAGKRDETYHISLSKEFGFTFSNWGSSIASGTLPQEGRWHHVAVSNVGNRTSLYIDSIRVSASAFRINTSQDGALFLGGVPKSIVRRASIEGNYAWDNSLLAGRMADIRIFDRALTDSEISIEYKAGKRRVGL